MRDSTLALELVCLIAFQNLESGWLSSKYTSRLGQNGPEFYLNDKKLDLTSLEIFQLAQTEVFAGDRGVSAVPAEVGLRISSRPPLSELELISKPRGGDWIAVTSGTDWIDDGSTLYLVSILQKQELDEYLVELGLRIGSINFRDAPRVAAAIGDSFHVEIDAPDWSNARDRKEKGVGAHRLAVNLHAYQIEAVERLADFCRMGLGAVLADEMGLGKTLQAIAVMVTVINRGGQALVVVPPVLMPNWRRELKKFAPSLHVGLHHRPGGHDLQLENLEEFDVVLTPFSSLTSKQGDYELLNSIDWDLVVVDEAQFIKNPDAKRSIAAKSLKRASSLALSGTPVENSPLDIWSLSEFIFPSLLGSRDDFDTDIQVSEVAISRVNHFFRPMMIRRTLEDVASDLVLPDRIEQHEYLELGSEKLDVQREIIEAQESSQSKFNSLLMLAAEAHQFETLESLIAGNKWQRLQMLIENSRESSEKLIVFARYKRALDHLLLAMQEMFPGIFTSVIRGDSGTPEQRQLIVDQFSEAEFGVLFLNPEAAGFGLNITSASQVVHLHPLWNPAKTDQATKRAHRPGQTKVTKVYHFIYEKSVEELIADRSEAKRQLARSLLEGHPVEADAATIADLISQVGKLASE